ncbi:CoA transferase [Pseudomonas capeferrum]|uniref:CoA transferase n=1 Tax=Pseudomonas capeferrum TaxID=1495066 RepID=UPI0015E2C85A|nr:CoA transferase [Pseudomonas capeferrum]MBA1204315.1 CoA transferase [Pseudomonas capeferrum]
MSRSILEGIRVISLCSGIAGSAAGLHLGQAGAEVIMIEPPRNPGRDQQALFAVLNRGKRSVILDLETPTARVQLQHLLASADVLLHDFTPAVAARLGLVDAVLLATFPKLVVSAIGGWPQGHALADAMPRETLILARLGLLDEQPGHRPGPVFVRMPYANWLASWLCAIGVMARLLARNRDGCGGIAHTSLAQAALVPMTMHWSRAKAPTPEFAKGLDKHIPIPLHQCADGRWVHVHYSPDKAPWMAAGLAELGDAEVARLNALWPPSHVAPNFGANKAIMATRPAQAWIEHFWLHDVAAQIAAPFGEVYFDEQARLNGYVVEVEDAQLGKILQPGPAWQVQPPAKIGAAAPHAGEGNAQLLRAACAGMAQQPASNLAPVAPLQGVKVLDLGAYLAGPFACMLLADLGAEVIKVEAPKGDAMRRLERTFSGTQRGKLGVALQLGVEQTQPAVEALVRWADVVHHNMRLPAARKLKVDYEHLKALNPRLVYCHVSAYGPAGPRADWPGFDQLMQASCGWEMEQGGEDQAPMWLRFGVGDFFAGMSSLYALLLGLYQRNRSGEGQAVNASLLGATLLTISEAVAKQDGSITPIEHLDAQQTGLGDTHRLYRCNDAWVAVAALQADEADRFRQLVGPQPHAWFADLARQVALERLRAAQVPAEAVMQAQMEPFLDSPEHSAAGLHAHYSHAVYGDMQQIGAFWDFGNLPLSLQRPPPALGQHTRQVLEALGIASHDLERLAAVGLVAL